MCCYCLLFIGVGGNFGKVLCECLFKYVDFLCLFDILNFGEVCIGEELVLCDLVDVKVVDVFVVGMDVIVYLGGVLVERLFEEILLVNIVGIYNLYEVVCCYGVCCIVFVSLNYIIGFYKQGEVIDSIVFIKFDGYYGLSKVFGEQLVSFYFDCYGIEMVVICIGFLFVEVKDCCMFVIWFGYDDLE